MLKKKVLTSLDLPSLEAPRDILVDLMFLRHPIGLYFVSYLPMLAVLGWWGFRIRNQTGDCSKPVQDTSEAQTAGEEAAISTPLELRPFFYERLFHRYLRPKTGEYQTDDKEPQPDCQPVFAYQQSGPGSLRCGCALSQCVPFHSLDLRRYADDFDSLLFGPRVAIK